jgi:hypothetical protein
MGTLVMVGMNKKNYSPPLNAIKELHYSKFRGKAHKMEAAGGGYGVWYLSRGSAPHPVKMTFRLGAADLILETLGCLCIHRVCKQRLEVELSPPSRWNATYLCASKASGRN